VDAVTSGPGAITSLGIAVKSLLGAGTSFVSVSTSGMGTVTGLVVAAKSGPGAVTSFVIAVTARL
jgi:hypothetical protein